MLHTFSRPIFWLEFRLLSDGLETAAVHDLPLTAWHDARTPVFHRFSALPAELRLKIWEYLIVPRIVGIACLCLEDGASSIETQREELWGPHSAVRSPVPVLLHVNRETRALALKHYELSFEWKVPRELAGTDLHPPVRVRSPILATPVPPTAPGPTQTPTQDPEPAADSVGTSLPHISSYHDLLDPSPGASTPSSSTPRLVDGSTSKAELRSGLARPDTSTITTTTTTTGQATTTYAHSSSSPPSPAPAPARRTSSPPRTWFNFDLDAVYLLGELEPCDSFGFNNPMTYFIPSQTTRRVRKAAVSFGALHYGETGGQQIFGALFHVVDRFRPADGELLVCVTERDEWTHAMMGNDTGLVNHRRRHRHRRRVQTNTDVVDTGAETETATATATARDDDGEYEQEKQEGKEEEDEEEEEENNVVQQLWRAWYRGAIVTSPLASMRFPLIPEHDLGHYVYNSMVAARRK